MNPREGTPDARRERDSFLIETVVGPHESEMQFCAERGGLIISLKLRDTELLYFDEATFTDTVQNVRGGIPVLFPNAGEIKSDRYPGLPRHGFARASPRWRREHAAPEHGFSLTLTADQLTKKLYPYAFRLNVTGILEPDGSCTITQAVSNLEQRAELPVAMGLHPYFRVPQEKKQDIKFHFSGGEIAGVQADIWMNSGTVSIENPALTNPEARIAIDIPDLGTVSLYASPEYQRIWIWSMPCADFVCVEPVMRETGGLLDDPEKISPGETITGRVNIRLEL